MADFGKFISKSGLGRASGQTAFEIQRTADRLDKAEMATKPGQTVVGKHGENMYPARLTRPTPEQDQRMKLLEEFTGPNKPFKEAELTPQIQDYILNKQKDAEFYDREQWIATHFDLSSPEKAAWFRSVMPSFTERRRQFGEAKLAMQKQLFDISLYGPRKEEDIDFLFAIEAGKLNLTELSTPIWEKPAGTAEDRYKAGIFAPRQNVTHLAEPGVLSALGLGMDHDVTKSRFTAGTAGNLAGGYQPQGLGSFWRPNRGVLPNAFAAFAGGGD
jgi:hypothetical protein